MGRPSIVGDVSGAFADSAVLFPLLLALAWHTGASAAMMLATAGAAYLVTGWAFRLPIPVQPLKSLAILAIAAGASLGELRLAGMVLGALYLGLSLTHVDAWAARVPEVLVHGFQLGLGVLLASTAVGLVGAEPGQLALLGVLLVVLLALARGRGTLVLGGLALGGLVWGVWHAGAPPSPSGEGTLRIPLIALMVLGQIPLTLTNSVLGTENAARRYYGAAAWRVSPSRLLRSLGVGNLVVAGLGGLPYCHGSGGVTAHYRGGARTARANAVIGGTLLAVAAFLVLAGGGLPAYPVALQALLLALIGVFHVQLAGPSWRTPGGPWILVSMGAAALLSQDMLVVLVVGVAAMAVRAAFRRYGPWRGAAERAPYALRSGAAETKHHDV